MDNELTALLAVRRSIMLFEMVKLGYKKSRAFEKLWPTEYEENIYDCWLCEYVQVNKISNKECSECPMFGRWEGLEGGEKDKTCLAPDSLYKKFKDAELSQEQAIKKECVQKIIDALKRIEKEMEASNEVG